MGRRGLARRRSRAGLAAGLLLLALLPARAAEGEGVTREADGILARLRIEGEAAVFGWRFLHRPRTPVNSIEATLNGRPLGAPAQAIAPFPASGQSAALVCLIDRSDPGRAEAVHAAGETVAALPAALPHRVALTMLGFGAPDAATAANPDAAPGTTAPGDLVDALGQAIDTAGAQPADRRAVLVLGDGFSARPVPVEDLAARATDRAVAVFFMITPSMRLADLASLGRLAEATKGGMFAPTADLPTALAHTILSGAELRFPFEGAARYVWEPQATVTVALGYGSRRLDLSLATAVPAAGLGETGFKLWRRGASRLPAFGAGVLLMLVGLVVFRMARGPRRPI